MRSITFDTAGGVLLLSSVSSLALLIKRTPKSRFKSFTSVSSISDVASSLLTGTMVLMHQFYMSNDPSKEQIDSARSSRYENSTLVPGEPNGREKSTNLSGAEVEGCDFKSVFFQYAIFLTPFASAFIFLLNFSTSCYNDSAEICRKCSELNQVENVEVEAVSETGAIQKEDKAPPRKRSSRSKYAALAIASQWIVPLFLSGIFQFSKHGRMDLTSQSTEDSMCSITANFLFESCADDFDFEISRIDHTQDENPNEIGENDEGLQLIRSNSSNVHDVVSRIFSIVQVALNNSNANYHNTSQMFDIVDNEAAGISSVENQAFVDGNDIDPELELFRQVEHGNNTSEVSPVDYGKYESDRVESAKDTLPNDKDNVVFNNIRMPDCMKNRCVVPMNFLKLYLLLFLFLVYFAPIFISTVLLIVSHYKCREIIVKLKANESKLRPTRESTEAGDRNSSKSTETSDTSSKSGWFSAGESSKRNDDVSVDKQSVNENEQSKHCSTSERMMCELLYKTDKMRNFFQIFKFNLLVAVALWTPLFLQILAKVFLCSNIPSWLVEISFLATIVSAIIRNATILDIMKIESVTKNSKKRNSIYPN